MASKGTPTAKPRSDAYTGMLAISLGAMIVGCALLALDWYQYPEAKPPEPLPPVTAKALAGAPPAAAPAPAAPAEK